MTKLDKTLDRIVASHNLATVLRARGWKVYGHAPASFPTTWHVWHGCATHDAKYPGVVLVVNNRSDICIPIDGCPTYQANPDGTMWHIEVLGMIQVSGTGFRQCTERGDELPGTRETALRIEGQAETWARTVARARAMQQAVTAAGVTLEQEQRWLWLTFPQQPPRELRRQLGQLGGKFSSARRSWYFKDSDVRPAVEKLVGL
jgi:hypothetical protein